MKKSLKRLLCLVLSVLLFTMSIPVLAADATGESTTTETPETNLPGLELLENLKPLANNSNYDYVIVAENPDQSKREVTWDDFRENILPNLGMKAKILLKTDIDLNPGFTFQSTEGSGNVKIVYNEKNQKKIVNIDVNGDVTADPNSKGKKPTEEDLNKAITPWTPIGTKETDGESKPFEGVFNAFKYDEKGNITGVYTISGLYINPDTASDNVGLFGYIEGATIAGVRIQNSYIRGRYNVGALVGNSNHSSKIIGCVNGTGSVVIGENNVGGVVGSFDIDNSATNVGNANEQDQIYECVNRGYVYGVENVGGIVGYTYHTLIRDSFNMHADTDVIVDTETDTDAQADEETIVHTGYVEGTKYVGGIVGRAVSTVIYGCTNYGVVGLDTTEYVGGIVGQIDMIKSYLREVVNAGSATVTGTKYVGGIVGYLGENDGESAGEGAAELELFMAYNHGTVNGTDMVGGLVGYNAARGKVFNSYSSGPVVVEQDDGETKNANNGNIVGVNYGEVRDCFYYPQKNSDAIGNGIGNGESYTGEKIHVVGLTVDALDSEAAAYLLNLVYMGEGADVHEAGYHHLATHEFGDNAWTTPTYWMAGNNGPEFTENTSLAAKTIKSASLLLNQNFNLVFKVYVPSGLSTEVIRDRQVTVYQEGTKLEFGDTISAEYETEKDANGNIRYYYEFTLTGIEPHYLGDKFEVIFTAKYALPEWNEEKNEWVVDETNAILVSEKRDYSVLDYCTRQLNRTKEELGFKTDEDYNKFVTLICNVLEYGAQYQIYRNAEFPENPVIPEKDLVNAVLTEKGLTPTNFWNQKDTAPGENLITANFEYNADTIYASNTLVRFGSANALGLILYIDDITKYDENLVVVEIMKSTDSQNPKQYTIADLKKEPYGTSGKYFMAVSDPMSVTEYKTTYTFTVKVSKDETKLPIVTYNMEHFVASLLECGDRREPAIKALWDYYYAAMQYNKPESSDDDTTGGITLDTDNIFDADVWDKIEEDSGYDPDDPYADADGDKIPDSWVELNISSSLARLLSIFNPLIRLFFRFEIVQYNGAWYARPSGIDWNL